MAEAAVALIEALECSHEALGRTCIMTSASRNHDLYVERACTFNYDFVDDFCFGQHQASVCQTDTALGCDGLGSMLAKSPARRLEPC